MPEFLQRLLDQTSEVWNQLEPAQRVLIGSISVAIVIGLILALFWVRQPNYVTLYSGLDQRDAAAIAKILNENDIPFRVTDGSTEVQVPDAKHDGMWLRDKAWILASNANLPAKETGLVGFEIFDERELGMTDAQFQQKYQRALQGHLSRLISGFNGVRSAIVTIVPEEKTLFREDQEEAKAAVSITLEQEGEKSFGREQVLAVANLISHSVPGLKKENISIVVDSQDVSELMKSEGLNVSTVDASLKQLEAQRKIEQYFHDKIQSVLNRTLGRNKAEIIVRADLDFTQLERETETFAPPIEDETEGIIRSEHEKRENYMGVPGGMPGGVPGVDTNVPGPPQYPTAQGGTQPSEYDMREFTRNYEMNRSVERVAGPAGGTHIRKLSAAVLVDQSLAQIPNLKQEIEGTIKTALANANTTSDPDVHVSFIPFEQPETVPAAIEPWWEKPAELSLIALIVLSIVFLLRSMLIRRELPLSQEPTRIPEFEGIGPIDFGRQPMDIDKPPSDLEPVPEEKEEEPELTPEEIAKLEEEQRQREEEEKKKQEEEEARRKEHEEEERRRAILESVGEYLRENPAAAAQLLAMWIIEDEDHSKR